MCESSIVKEKEKKFKEMLSSIEDKHGLKIVKTEFLPKRRLTQPIKKHYESLDVRLLLEMDPKELAKAKLAFSYKDIVLRTHFRRVEKFEESHVLS